jgi:hypothetical protein
MPPGFCLAAFFIGRAIGHRFQRASSAGQDRDMVLIHLQKSSYLAKNERSTGRTFEH